MRFIKNGLTRRVALLTLLVALVLAVVISLALLSFNQYKQTLDEVADNQVQALVSATRLVQQSEGLVNASAMLLLAENHFARRQAVFEAEDRKEWFGRLVQELEYYRGEEIDFRPIKKAQKELFDNLNTINDLVRQRINLRVDVYHQEKVNLEALKQLELIDAQIGEMIRTSRALSRELTITAGQQVSHIRSLILQEVEVMHRNMVTRETLLFYFGGLALLVALLVAFYINRSVVGRVVSLQKALSLKSPQSNDILIEGHDEIAWMAQSIRRYVDKINNNEKRILEMNEELSFLASHDALTKLFNRHYFDRKINEISQKKTGSLLSAAMLDIDHFKKINDTYGHDVGDQVIIQIAGHLQKELPSSALLARIGGEEFAVIFQELDIEQAAGVLEKLRYRIADRAFVVAEQALQITVSMGLAGYCLDGDLVALLKQADQALYQAKNQGRNQLVVKQWEQMNES